MTDPEKLPGFKILLAEDNPVNQDLAKRLLTKRGHDVTVVENGKLALEAIDQDSFDLVLMDLEMPEMDGFEATRNIRQREHETTGSSLPVIALTAYDEQEMRKEISDAGFNGVINKPFSPRSLDAEIRVLVDKAQQ